MSWTDRLTQPRALIVIVGVCAIAFFGWRGRRREHAPPADPLDPSQLAFSTSEEADERASVVLPNGPSEDASHVLGDPPAAPDALPEGYGPDEATEWYVELATSAPVTEAAIEAAFDPAWREAHDGMFFGRDPRDARWTYVFASDAPPTFDALRIAWRFVSLDGVALDAAAATQHAADVGAVAARLGGMVTRTSLTPAEAEARARVIVDAVNRFDAFDVQVMLVAPAGSTYDGVRIWDALASLGITWGDGDFFHWENETHLAGDDHLFSVGTSTPPGYFFPEDAIAGRIHVADLDFGFALARSYEPVQIFDAMMRAVRYVQQRLGGTIEDGHGIALDEATLRERVRERAAAMTEAGFTPGRRAALRTF